MKSNLGDKILKSIRSNKILLGLVNWSRNTSLPGFFGIPVYDIIQFCVEEIKKYDLVTRANSAAYSFFLSLFPSLILILTLLPYFSDLILASLPGGENFFETFQNEIMSFLPGETSLMISDTLKDLTLRMRPNLLSLSFLTAIFISSNGMRAMMKGFEKSDHSAFKKRSELRNRLIAIFLTAVLGLLLLISVSFIIVGNNLIHLLNTFYDADWITQLSLSLIRYLSILIIFYFGIAFIYKYGVPTHRKFSLFSAGTTLATISCILITILFSIYLDNFNTYNKLYGSIGTIIALMLWIQMNCLMILLGFELNASIAVNRDLRKKTLKELEDSESEEEL